MGRMVRIMSFSPFDFDHFGIAHFRRKRWESHSKSVRNAEKKSEWKMRNRPVPRIWISWIRIDSCRMTIQVFGISFSCNAFQFEIDKLKNDFIQITNHRHLFLERNYKRHSTPESSNFLPRSLFCLTLLFFSGESLFGEIKKP